MNTRPVPATLSEAISRLEGARIQRDKYKADRVALELFRDWSDQDGNDDQLDRAMGAARATLAQVRP